MSPETVSNTHLQQDEPNSLTPARRAREALSALRACRARGCMVHMFHAHEQRPDMDPIQRQWRCSLMAGLFEWGSVEMVGSMVTTSLISHQLARPDAFG